MTATFERVKVDRIAPHDRNVRRNLGDLDELAASIKAQGLLQPLVVAPVAITQEEQAASSGLLPQRYVLIAGHRRHAAAKQAGLETVPCIVRDDLDTSAKVIEAMLVENLQRTDLTVMEEADAYAQLELLGVKEAAISKTTGRSRKTVHERLLLASLPTERRQQYETGKLSLDGGVKCAKLRQQYADDAEIMALIDEAQTWAFGDNYGVKHRIDRLLEDRKRAAEPEPEAEEDDEGTIDYAGKRAEREAAWEKRRQENAKRAEALAAMRERAVDWLSGRLVAKDQHVIDGIVDWAIDDLFDNYDANDTALAFVGIEPCGEDEDYDDATLRKVREAHAMSREDKVILLALIVGGAVEQHAYDWRDWAERYEAMGHRLSVRERDLIGPQSQEADDAVA